MNIAIVKECLKTVAKDKLGRVVVDPLNEILDEAITDVVTSIGSFVINSIRGKFTRSITLNIANFGDRWMEDALYGILYRYNDIKRSSNLELSNAHDSSNDGSGMYYRLAPGTHSLKYRNFDVLVIIQSSTPVTTGRSSFPQKTFTLITYNLDPEFIINFEKDMVRFRNSLLHIKSDSPTVNVYQDFHEAHGYTLWSKELSIPKRRLSTVYLPYETKKLIVDTVNNFFQSREYYRKHGISHNLKILLYGEPGVGKDTLAKTIASEWNRNIYYVTGGKTGRFIPEAITDNSNEVTYPLFIISDIDKHPFLINDTEVNLSGEGHDDREDKIGYKQSFGQMINALDGVMSGEGRVIIMTTNHIEKFSPVFLRPGRIDLLLEMKYVCPEVFRKYVYDFYGEIIPKDIKLKNNKLTIADLQFDIVFGKMKFNEFMKKHCK